MPTDGYFDKNYSISLLRTSACIGVINISIHLICEYLTHIPMISYYDKEVDTQFYSYIV